LLRIVGWGAKEGRRRWPGKLEPKLEPNFTAPFVIG
jgi:hypothetical protein